MTEPLPGRVRMRPAINPGRASDKVRELMRALKAQ